MIQWVYLTLKEIFSNRFISLIALVSVLISVFSSSLFLIVEDNFKRHINDRFAASIPPDMIKISPKPHRTILFFTFREPGAAVIDSKMLKKIRKIPGVKQIYPVMLSRVPSQGRISFLGLSNYRTDMMCLGLPYGLIKNDLQGSTFKKMWKNHDASSRIPVLIPRSLLRAYNDGMAEANGLPQMSEKKLTGLRFKILMGYSSIRRSPSTLEIGGTVAGFTDRVNTLAVMIPLSAAKYYNRRLGNGVSNEEYAYVFLKVRDHRALIEVSSGIKKMGFEVEAEKSVSKKIILLQNNVSVFLKLLTWLIVILAVIAISSSTMIAVFNRLEYYRIMRVLGAPKIFITATILIKYLLLGLAGSALAFGLIECMAVYKSVLQGIIPIKIDFVLQDRTRHFVIICGMIIPVVSTFPAVIRLLSRELGND